MAQKRIRLRNRIFGFSLVFASSFIVMNLLFPKEDANTGLKKQPAESSPIAAFAADNSAAKDTSEAAHTPVIESGAYMAIKKADAPKLYKQWGPAWMERINTAMEKAVTLAANSPKCDSVYMSGLSFDKSTPKKEIVVFADCRNQNRFYFTEEETIKGTVSTSLAEKLAKASDTDLIFACRDLAREKLRFKSSMDISMFGASITRGQLGVSIAVPFKAKNALGNTLPYVAHCSFDGDATSLISVKEN